MALVGAVLCCAATSSAAQPPAGPLRKFSRGAADTVFGVLEIPLTISEVGRDEGPIAAVSYGLLLGSGAAVTRTLAGVAELLTFPIPFATVGYGPIVEPEFLLHPDHPHRLPWQSSTTY